MWTGHRRRRALPGEQLTADPFFLTRTSLCRLNCGCCYAERSRSSPWHRSHSQQACASVTDGLSSPVEELARPSEATRFEPANYRGILGVNTGSNRRIPNRTNSYALTQGRAFKYAGRLVVQSYHRAWAGRSWETHTRALWRIADDGPTSFQQLKQAVKLR